MDRVQLADFLRTRREALQPEDVGLTRGPRRRTSGLRREEVAALAGMSVDYWGRLEQGRGPQPSTQMLTSIARGLRLSLAERDHLFRLAGHGAPARAARSDHIAPGILRIIDRLQDTPAEVLSELGETLLQTPAARIVDALSRESAEFREVWARHEVTDKHPAIKRFAHPELGELTLECETLLDTDTGQRLLVFTATPGTEDAERLALLSVIGAQRIGASRVG